MEIREYDRDDWFGIAALADGEWRNEIKHLVMSLRRYDGKIERVYVAEHVGEIVGFVSGFILPSGTLIVELVYVRPDWRKRGVGSELLRKIEKDSDCSVSLLFYHKSLHDHYLKRGYQTGDNMEVGLKILV